MNSNLFPHEGMNHIHRKFRRYHHQGLRWTPHLHNHHHLCLFGLQKSNSVHLEDNCRQNHRLHRHHRHHHTNLQYHRLHSLLATDLECNDNCHPHQELSRHHHRHPHQNLGIHLHPYLWYCQLSSLELQLHNCHQHRELHHYHHHYLLQGLYNHQHRDRVKYWTDSIQGHHIDNHLERHVIRHYRHLYHKHHLVNLNQNCFD